jgi:hypothetical protein
LDDNRVEAAVFGDSIIEHFNWALLLVVLQINVPSLVDFVEGKVLADDFVHFEVFVHNDCEVVRVILVENRIQHMFEPKDLLKLKLLHHDAKWFLVLVFAYLIVCLSLVRLVFLFLCL